MNKPIRVLHVLQRMEAAGVQVLLMNIYRNIDRTKVQFDFLVHYTEKQFYDEEIEMLGGHIYRLSVREDYNLIKYCADLNTFFNEHTEYKIVHGHMHFLGAIYLYIASKHGVPVRIAHSHTNNVQKDAKKLIKAIMNNLYGKYATNLFACSSEAGKYMFGESQFRVINNAIEIGKFEFKQENRIRLRKELNIDDKFVIGCVGRFEIQKNQKFSLKIFEEILKINPASVLLFIGSGSMEKEIKYIAYKKNIESSVIFLGNRSDVAELYHAMDVFLFPSIFEGLGIVGVEAQAAGTPIVCTDTLPREINISPLIYRISLNESPEKWAKKVEEAANNVMAHTDMKKFIVDANYDISLLAKEMQDFYLKKYTESR